MAGLGSPGEGTGQRTPPAAEPSTVTADPLAQALPEGHVLAERYRIGGLLGIGGMGMVYRAEDLSLGVPVALKLLRPELSLRPDAFERFRQEVLLARQVSSPHVLRIHDIARDGDRWFISMDLVEGEALDRRIARSGRLDLEEALGIARQIALGLAAAHDSGVVHRDLKPSNVLLAGDDTALISDFGVARSLGGSGLTQAGAIVGTPDYLSPEQARGQPVDGRSDLYALGLLLFEMLTGRLPFSGETLAETLSQRLGGFHIPLRRLRPDAPAWLERLINRLLRPQPAQRLASATQVLHVLAQRRLPADWPSWRRRGGLAMGAAGLLLAGLWLRPDAPPPAAEAPLARLAVLPIVGDAWSSDATRAVADHVRRAIDADSPLPAVDGVRSEHAFQRHPQPVTTSVPAGLREELPASRWLQLEFRREGDAVIARARLFGADGAAEPGVLEGAPSARPDAALAALAAGLADALGAERIRLALPAQASLDAQGQALASRMRGEIESALEGFAAALASDAGNGAAAMAMAETAAIAGDGAAKARALALAEQAIDAADSPMLAAMLAQQRGDWAAAEAILRRRAEARAGDAAARAWLADSLATEGRLAEAESALEEALAIDAGDPRLWFLRGKFAVLRGEIRPAVDDYLVRAVLLAKRDRDRFIEAEATNALGVAFDRLGQTADAEEQYRRALGLRRAIGHRRGVAAGLRNLAVAAMVQGRREEAGRLLAEAREAFEQIQDRAGLAAVENEAGLLFEETGDYAAAHDAYRRALREREALGDRHGVAESLNNLGFAQFQVGDYDSARVYWRQALDAFERLDNLAGRIRAQQNLGLLETVRGGWEDAERLLQDSLRAARAQQLAEEAAVSERNLAELAWLRGDLAQALAHLDRAAEGFAERSDLRGRIDVGLLHARVMLAAGRRDAARSALDSLGADLAEATPEQQALAALLRVEIAGEGSPDAAQAMADAERWAARAGVLAVQLAVEVRKRPGQEGLEQRLERLDHQPLRLAWLGARIGVAGDLASLRIDYSRLQSALQRSPGYFDAHRLHAAAAARFARLGDATAAAAATDSAQQAAAVLRAGLPEDWRAEFDAADPARP